MQAGKKQRRLIIILRYVTKSSASINKKTINLIQHFSDPLNLQGSQHFSGGVNPQNRQKGPNIQDSH